MQQLHLVGFTTDHEHLIFSARRGAKSGGFLVPIEAKLLEVLAEAVRQRAEDGDTSVELPDALAPEPPPPPAPPRPRVESLLTPREIQARLRAGRSVREVAAEAHVDEAWVERFAAPVLAEQRRIVERALDLLYTKPRRGPSAEPLRLSVRWNLADRGIRMTDDEFMEHWSAFHVADTRWGVVFEFVSRGRSQRAEWELDLADGELLARTRLATDLGYAEPGRRRRVVSLEPGPASADSKPARATRTATSRRRPATKAAPAKKTAKTAKAAKKAPAKKAAAKRSPAARVPVKKASTRKAAARKAPAKKAAARKAAARKAAKRPGPSRSRGADLPPPPETPRPPPRTPLDELTRAKPKIARGEIEPPRRPRRPPRPVDVTEARPPEAIEPAEPEPVPAPERVEAGEEDAAARRAERRRARAERRNGDPDAADAASGSHALDGDEPDDLVPAVPPRLVTIRAPRATPGDGEVVVSGGRRPLRPALPAAQPRRRRFSRDR